LDTILTHLPSKNCPDDINLQCLPVSDVYDNYHKKLTEMTLRREEWEAEKNERISSLIWYTPELAEKLHLPQRRQTLASPPFGWIENFSAKKNREIIFPLKVKPKNDLGEIWESYYWGITNPTDKGVISLFSGI